MVKIEDFLNYEVESRGQSRLALGKSSWKIWDTRTLKMQTKMLETKSCWDTGTLKMQTGWDTGTSKMQTIWDTGTLKLWTDRHFFIRGFCSRLFQFGTPKIRTKMALSS